MDHSLQRLTSLCNSQIYVVREDQQYKYVFDGRPQDIRVRQQQFFQ